MYENEGARSEVEVVNCVRMLLFELADRGEAAGEDVVMNGSEVGWAFLELASTGEYKVFG